MRGYGFPIIAIKPCPAGFEPRRHDPILVDAFFLESTFMILDSEPATPLAS